MGIPVIVNSGVGDVETIVTKSNGGFILHEFSKEHYLEAVRSVHDLLKKDPLQIRENIKDVYSLEQGIRLYSDAYRNALS